ncbi:MAG: hypothetical protein AAF961_09035 [Planctomycetota bacterium]
MRSNDSKRRSIGLLRPGLSVVEFVACLCALAGGLALGSLYLGVDLKAVAVSALEAAEDVDHQPAADSSERAGATDRDEVAGERHESSTPPSAPSDIPTSGTEPSEEGEQTVKTEEQQSELSDWLPSVKRRSSLTSAENREPTKRYWSDLDEAMRVEKANRT